jgi:lantibiotic transport system permease protein
MTAMIRALSAEVLKTKRTLTLWLVLLAPLAIAFLVFVMYMQTGARTTQPNTSAWLSLTQQCLILWALLMLPLFVTLETGLLNAQEHDNKMWKQLYATPLPRWIIYAAKQLMGLALVGASTVVLLAMSIGVGLLLNRIKPELGLAPPIEWAIILPAYALVYLAAWLIISLHLWVSARWPSFIVAMGVGIVATVAGAMVINSDWAKVYPWALPGLASIGFMEGNAIAAQAALGLAGGIAVALAGGWDVAHRDIF